MVVVGRTPTRLLEVVGALVVFLGFTGGPVAGAGGARVAAEIYEYDLRPAVVHDSSGGTAFNSAEQTERREAVFGRGAAHVYDGLPQLVRANADPGGYRSAPQTAGSIRRVNPLGGAQNCVNCAIATDATLAGRPASAPSGRRGAGRGRR